MGICETRAHGSKLIRCHPNILHVKVPPRKQKRTGVRETRTNGSKFYTLPPKLFTYKYLPDDKKCFDKRSYFRFLILYTYCSSVFVLLCCCCCCSHINSRNQVRGHRTVSSHSGAEEYPREKHKQPKVVHAYIYITADVNHALTRNI